MPSEWGDDEETPLAFVVKAQKAAVKPKPDEKKKAEKKDKPKQEKKAKASKGSDGMNVDDILRARDATKSNGKPEWRKIVDSHGSKIAVAACILAILYFR